MRRLPFRSTYLVTCIAVALQAMPSADEAPPNSFLEAIRQAQRAQAGQSAAPAPAPLPALAPSTAPPVPAVKAVPTVTPVAASPEKPASKAVPRATPAQAPAPAPTPAAASAEAVPSPAPSEIKAEPISAHNDVRIQQPRLDAGGGVTLRFDNAEIFEVVQTIMGDILHLNYVIDPGVTGKVNINGLSPVSPEDLLGVLQSVLAFNNVSIVRDGNLYKVMRDAMVPRDVVSGAAAGNNGALIQIFAPRYVQPSAILNTLKAFVGPQAAIVNDPTDHYLIVVDRAANMKKLADILQALDVDYLSAIQTEMVQIENGDATEVAKEMETLFKTSQMYNWKGTEANKVFFMPIKRMNAILVAAANKDVLDAAKRRIKDVDIAPKNGLNSRINIYTVRNNSADYLAGIIGQIYGGAAPSGSSSNQRMSTISMSSPGSTAPTATPTRVIEKGPVGSTSAAGAGLSGEVQIIPNSKSNSLIIKAGRQDYLQILQLLEQLDTPPRQVLIQANIFEITLNNDNELGVTWKLLGNNRLKFNGNTYNTTTTLNPVTNASSLASGFVYGITDSANNILSQIQAVASTNHIRVLSAPHVLASDGKEAKIELGEDVPISTGSVITPTTTGTATGNTVTNSIAYRTVGLLLHVKPSINESGLIDLEIDQEVSDILDKSTNNTPTLSKRSVSTDVSVEDGKTIVIGGLIKDKDTHDDNGVPYLKDVPLLGSLFRYQQKAVERTELLLTITPYIVRTPSDAERLSQELDAATAALRRFAAEKAMGRHVSTSPIAATPLPGATH